MEVATIECGAGSVTSGRLGSLLDKLVAVDLDLETIFDVSRGSAAVSAPIAIADACDVLHGAIADLRNFIYQADAMMNVHSAAAAEVK